VPRTAEGFGAGALYCDDELVLLVELPVESYSCVSPCFEQPTTIAPNAIRMSIFLIKVETIVKKGTALAKK
jgi:hypothetical protein